MGEAHTQGGRRAPKCFVPLFFFEENGVCRWHAAIQVPSMFGKLSHLLFLPCEPQLDLMLELKRVFILDSKAFDNQEQE